MRPGSSQLLLVERAAALSTPSARCQSMRPGSSLLLPLSSALLLFLSTRAAALLVDASPRRTLLSTQLHLRRRCFYARALAAIRCDQAHRRNCSVSRQARTTIQHGLIAAAAAAPSVDGRAPLCNAVSSPQLLCLRRARLLFDTVSTATHHRHRARNAVRRSLLTPLLSGPVGARACYPTRLVAHNIKFYIVIINV